MNHPALRCPHIAALHAQAYAASVAACLVGTHRYRMHDAAWTLRRPWAVNVMQAGLPAGDAASIIHEIREVRHGRAPVLV